MKRPTILNIHCLFFLSFYFSQLSRLFSLLSRLKYPGLEIKNRRNLKEFILQVLSWRLKKFTCQLNLISYSYGCMVFDSSTNSIKRGMDF